jgi:hypothetical protein
MQCNVGGNNAGQGATSLFVGKNGVGGLQCPDTSILGCHHSGGGRTRYDIGGNGADQAQGRPQTEEWWTTADLFFPAAHAEEVAKLDDATLDKQRCHEMAAQEKALADKANKQPWAATQEKALADEVNMQRRQVTAARENALTNDAFEQRYQELPKRAAASAESELAAEQAAVSTDSALPPTAMLPPPHRPTTYKDMVLSTMGGSLCAKSLIVAPLSCPSTTVDGQLQTACRRSRPCHRVGRRHGPRAPNPQEHLLCGR